MNEVQIYNMSITATSTEHAHGNGSYGKNFSQGADCVNLCRTYCILCGGNCTANCMQVLNDVKHCILSGVSYWMAENGFRAYPVDVASTKFKLKKNTLTRFMVYK